MKETLSELQTKLQALPDPKDKKLQEDLGLLKLVGRLLVMAVDLPPQKRKEMLLQNAKNAAALASRLGSENEGVQIVKKMLEIIITEEEKQ